MRIISVSFGLFILIRAVVSNAQTMPEKFVVVQSMHYKYGVDVSEAGVERNPIIYESSLLPSQSSDDLIKETAFNEFVKSQKMGSIPIVIDIERWSIYGSDQAERNANKEKLLDILRRVRAVRSDIKLGYYGVIPQRIYWPLVDEKKNLKRNDWEVLNDTARADFAPHVDAIFPSLYTFNEDQNAWRRYAKATLKAARKFDKPVYCYLWPQFHSSSVSLNGSYLSAKHWKMELETCYEHADGIVVWNYEPDKRWDPNAEWWLQTLRFLKSHGLGS